MAIAGLVFIERVGNPFTDEHLRLSLADGLGADPALADGHDEHGQFLDGLDGLSAGVAGIVSIVLLVHMLRVGHYGPALLPAALLGAMLGFLPFNVYPARIFLGSGAITLGYLIGTLSLVAGARVATVLLVMGIPIVDVAWQIVNRWRQGRSMNEGDRGHLHYRLQDLGWSQPQIVSVLLGLLRFLWRLALLVSSRMLKLIAILGLAAWVMVRPGRSCCCAGASEPAQRTTRRTIDDGRSRRLTYDNDLGSMSILTATNLYKAYDPQEIFWDVSVTIAHGEKIALVGPNGAGKTTLLRILIGLEEPTEGRVTRMGKIRIGYLPQDTDQGASTVRADALAALLRGLCRPDRDAGPTAPPGGAAWPTRKKGRRRWSAMVACWKRSSTPAAMPTRSTFAPCSAAWASTRCTRHRPLDQLSGGQRTRALLGRLLLEKPNILVLDEPTNHLDLEAIEWLEGYLQDLARGRVGRFARPLLYGPRGAQGVGPGLLDRSRSITAITATMWTQRADRGRAARPSGRRSRLSLPRPKSLSGASRPGSAARRRAGARRACSAWSAWSVPQEAHTIHLRLGSDQRSGELVLRTYDLVAGYDRPLVAVPDLELRRLQRAALIGPNGSGKTTLLKTVLGELPPLSGKVRLGASLRVGYLAQTREDLDLSRRVMDEVIVGQGTARRPRCAISWPATCLPATTCTNQIARSERRRAVSRGPGQADPERAQLSHPRRADQPVGHCFARDHGSRCCATLSAPFSLSLTTAT